MKNNDIAILYTFCYKICLEKFIKIFIFLENDIGHFLETS